MLRETMTLPQALIPGQKKKNVASQPLANPVETLSEDEKKKIWSI
jgi:hypothetical protein